MAEENEKKIDYSKLHEHSIDDLMKEYKLLTSNTVQRKISKDVSEYLKNKAEKFHEGYFNGDGPKHIEGKNKIERHMNSEKLIDHVFKEYLKDMKREGTIKALEEDPKMLKVMVDNYLMKAGIYNPNEGLSYEGIVQELASHDGSFEEILANPKSKYNALLRAMAHHSSEEFSNFRNISEHIQLRANYNENNEKDKIYEIVEKDLASRIDSNVVKKVELNRDIDLNNVLKIYGETQHTKYGADNIDELIRSRVINTEYIAEDLKEKYRKGNPKETIEKYQN